MKFECTSILGLMNTFEFCIEVTANARCLITQMILWSSARGARTGNCFCYSFVAFSSCWRFFFFFFCVISFLFDTDIVKAWKLALTRSSVLVKSSIAWRYSLFSKKEKKNIFINYKFFF